ncbi:MAG: hypothetical protein RMM58_13455 [Chloroflexota bacterium]|nr:hypothetical protein [Dehalococcoidia bacterium]MDW8254877.1 hypothetical protein [Chloroflexota bacterium]
MTTSAAPLSTVVGALALGLAALALATSGDFFRAALLGIAAYLVFNVLLWVAVQAWSASPPPPAPRVSAAPDVGNDEAEDDPAASPPAAEGGA